MHPHRAPSIERQPTLGPKVCKENLLLGFGARRRYWQTLVSSRLRSLNYILRQVSWAARLGGTLSPVGEGGAYFLEFYIPIRGGCFKILLCKYFVFITCSCGVSVLGSLLPADS